MISTRAPKVQAHGMWTTGSIPRRKSQASGHEEENAASSPRPIVRLASYQLDHSFLRLAVAFMGATHRSMGLRLLREDGTGSGWDRARDIMHKLMLHSDVKYFEVVTSPPSLFGSSTATQALHSLSVNRVLCDGLHQMRKENSYQVYDTLVSLALTLADHSANMYIHSDETSYEIGPFSRSPVQLDIDIETELADWVQQALHVEEEKEPVSAAALASKRQKRSPVLSSEEEEEEEAAAAAAMMLSEDGTEIDLAEGGGDDEVHSSAKPSSSASKRRRRMPSAWTESTLSLALQFWNVELEHEKREEESLVEFAERQTGLAKERRLAKRDKVRQARRHAATAARRGSPVSSSSHETATTNLDSVDRLVMRLFVGKRSFVNSMYWKSKYMPIEKQFTTWNPLQRAAFFFDEYVRFCALSNVDMLQKTFVPDQCVRLFANRFSPDFGPEQQESIDVMVVKVVEEPEIQPQEASVTTEDEVGSSTSSTIPPTRMVYEVIQFSSGPASRPVPPKRNRHTSMAEFLVEHKKEINHLQIDLQDYLTWQPLFQVGPLKKRARQSTA